jgi:hypothetical protein
VGGYHYYYSDAEKNEKARCVCVIEVVVIIKAGQDVKIRSERRRETCVA